MVSFKQLRSLISFMHESRVFFLKAQAIIDIFSRRFHGFECIECDTFFLDFKNMFPFMHFIGKQGSAKNDGDLLLLIFHA